MLIFGQADLTSLLWLWLLGAATVHYEEDDFVDEADEADNKAEQNGGKEDVGRVLLICNLRGRGGAFHWAVVEGNEQANKLTQMADVGTVVVECPSEGQIDQIVQQEQDRNSKHYQSGNFTYILEGHVKAKSCAI